jgi:hypothetical protein
MPLSLPKSKINDLVIDLSKKSSNSSILKMIIYENCGTGNIHDIKLEFKDYHLHFKLSHEGLLDYLDKNLLLDSLNLEQKKYLSSHFNNQNGF